ncbi:integrase [uncultured Roseibium sp.]|uniref:tyrosine-type recombinase/integrase n=1 Tax=uncultured Roseibium sp. TaxID=1936171 RepID=UPI0026110F37|nr:integrase [uncultured Roseibium sp.]
MSNMPKRRLPHLSREKSRHGRAKWFFRVGKGPRLRLPDEYDTSPDSEFMKAYKAALNGQKPEVKPKSRHSQNTLGWLFDMYQQSAKFQSLADGTQRARANIIKGIVAKTGHIRLANVTEKKIRQGRESKASTPEAANNFLKTMKAAFAWGVDSGLIDDDPARNVKKIQTKTDGFEPWTEEDIAKFEVRHALGTRQRLALDIFLCTSFRRKDGHLLGKQHVKDGIIRYRTSKQGVWVEMPLLPRLQQSIEATETGDLTFLITEKGKPFASAASLGTSFRKWCDEADVSKSIHGIRKFNAEVVAEGGATEHEMMALFGWQTADMASLYAKKANRGKLARRSAHLLDRK